MANIEVLNQIDAIVEDIPVIEVSMANPIYRGPVGPQGKPGVYVGNDEPADPTVKVWIDPDGGVLEEEYLTQADLKNYYTKPEVEALIPDVSSFITMADVEGKGYKTEEEIKALIQTELGVIENGTY